MTWAPAAERRFRQLARLTLQEAERAEGETPERVAATLLGFALGHALEVGLDLDEAAKVLSRAYLLRSHVPRGGVPDA